MTGFYQQKESGKDKFEHEVFVYNLPRPVTASDLKRYFCQFGPVVHVFLPLAPMEGNKGYGFVAFSSQEDKEKVLLEGTHHVSILFLFFFEKLLLLPFGIGIIVANFYFLFIYFIYLFFYFIIIFFFLR